MNTGGLLGGRGVAENTYQVQTTSVFLSRNVLANGRVRKAETIFTYMTHSQMLGKFEYTGGPIFKVVLEC